MRERVSREEWETRVDLAACYRLVHHYGMDDLVYNHISARVPGEEGHFLINAYGMTYDEITASSLVKIDLDGSVVQDSGTGYGINHAGFVIHSAVHRGRPDVACVIHTHTPAGMPHVRGGKIKALAMFSKERIQGAPEVPTIAEAGGPPLESSTWVLFMAPGGTPRPIVDRLAAETAKAINESEIKTRFNDIGIIAVGNTPAQAQQFLDAEVAKWAKVITTAGVKAEQ